MIFNKFFKHFQIKFKDRTSAAIALSDILKNAIKSHDKKDILILAIPRGGMVTADVISKKLSIKDFGFVIPKKLTDPDNKEQAIGAVIGDGFTFIMEDLVRDFQISKEYITKETNYQVQQIDLKKRKYFQNLQHYMLYQQLEKNNTILIVDDGIFTGATIIVTVKWIRQICSDLNLSQKKIIVASPVASKEVIEKLMKKYSLKVITIFSPSPNSFRSVEQYYQDFEQVSDERVLEIINERIIKNSIS